MLTVGLIGCGGIGSVHVNCRRALSDKVKLVAIADTIPEKTGAEIYSSSNEIGLHCIHGKACLHKRGGGAAFT